MNTKSLWSLRSNVRIILVVIVLVVGLFFLMGYNRIGHKGPISRHAWRQSDSYAYALNFYFEKNKLLEPSILFTGETGNGKTISEFPILYYLTAKIWNFSGIDPIVLRMINLMIVFIGLFYLYRFSFIFLKNHFWSVFVSLMLFSSPLLGFYSFNFIPNIPALGFALIACFYMWKYYESQKLSFLIVASILYAFSSMLKISSLFSFLALNAGFFFLNVIDFKKNSKKIWIQIGSILFVFLIVGSWLLFSKYYNSQNLNAVFNQSILPYWSLSSDQIQQIKNSMYFGNIVHFLNPIVLVLIVSLFFLSFVGFRWAPRVLLFVTTFLFIGVLLFIVLFFGAMDVHEYFLIDATIIIPFILIVFLTTLKEKLYWMFNSCFTKLFAIVVLLFSLNYSVVMTRSHYDPYDKIVVNNLPLASRIQENWKYNFWSDEVSIMKYDGIVPYLRKLGIKPTDKVVSIPDGSPNITLTLLNQKGFTDYHYWNNYEGKLSTLRKISLGAKYMIVRGEEALAREDVAPFTQNLIGEYNDIRIYRLP